MVAADLNSRIHNLDCIMEHKDKTEACGDNKMVSKGEIKEEYCWLERAVKSELEEPSVLDISKKNRNNSIRKEIKIESWEPNNISEEIKYESEGGASHQNKIDVFAESKNNISNEHTVITETEIKVEPLCWENSSAEIKSELERPALHDCQENGRDIVTDTKTATVVCGEDRQVDTKIEIKEESWWLKNMYTETLLSKASPDLGQNFQCDIQAGGSSASRITTGDFLPAGSAVLHTEGLDSNTSDFSTPFVNASSEKKDHINSSVSSANKIHDNQVAKASPVESYNMVHFREIHECDKCLKSFPALWRLKRHHLIHEDKRPYKCETCNKCFVQQSILQRHLETHKEKKTFICEICAFFSHFKDHVLIHVGKEPQKCAVCEKSFALLSALEKHGLVLRKGETYTCKSCCKIFTLV